MRNQLMGAVQWRKERKNAILCPNMTVEEIAKSDEFRSVVEDYRDTCLWYMNRVLRPENDLQLEQVLTAIENNGDLAAFKRVGEIRKWLPPGFRPLYSSGLPVRG